MTISYKNVIMFCTKCGQQFNGESNFCTGCGTTRHADNSQTTSQTHDSRYTSTPMVPLDYFDFGTGAKIWLWFCLVANGLSAIAGLLASFAVFEVSFGVGLGSMLVSILSGVACACFWKILKDRVKLPFYLIVGITIIAFIINIILAASIGQNMLMAFAGVGNPIITYLILRKYWSYMK